MYVVLLVTANYCCWINEFFQRQYQFLPGFSYVLSACFLSALMQCFLSEHPEPGEISEVGENSLPALWSYPTYGGQLIHLANKQKHKTVQRGMEKAWNR